MSSSTKLVFFVNGVKVEDDQVDPESTLLTYLRDKLRLCGTKLGCGEGGCGACTVMVSKYDPVKQKVIHLAVNACLTPVCAVHGASVTTTEGIGNVEKGLHPVQERIAKSHGSQCGFCTPGIVMSMYTLLRNKTLPEMEDVEVAFQGNLCRCTGYRPILEGYKTLTSTGMNGSHVSNGISTTKGGCCGKMANGCCMQNGISSSKSGCGEKAANGCCMQNGIPTPKSGCCGKMTNGCCMENGNKELGPATLYEPSEFKPFDPSQEPIFPPELLVNREYDETNAVFKGTRVTWYRPTTLKSLLELKSAHPNAKLVVGNTEIGVEVKFKNMHYPVIIQPSIVPELTDISNEPNGIRFGASVTLSELESVLNVHIKNEPAFKTRVFQAIVEMLRWFAGKQIRNAAAIGGNIITGSPISDLNPIFLAANCELVLRSEDGLRTVNMDEKFFTGYRRNILKPNEILQSILIPYTSEEEYFWGFKQAKRRDDDIAIVNAGMRVKLKSGTNIIENLALSFGGMAPTTVMAPKTSKALIGKPWDEKIVDEACRELLEDLPLDPGAPGSMIEFRRSLTLSFFFKFYLIVTKELSKTVKTLSSIPKEYESATTLYHRDPPKSTQLYQVLPPGESFDLVGQPIIHKSGLKQASGEAVYVDDMPRFENELYLALVLSSKAHAKIVNIDISQAKEVDGFIDFISAKDVPDENRWVGEIIHDEEVFASEKVTCIGQVIGAVIGINQAVAQRAAKLIKVEYEEIRPIIVTIQDAIKHDSYYEGFTRAIQNGDPEKGFQEADHILEGEMHLGGQEHFYLETQACIALPKNEDGEMELFCSTQNPSAIQHLTAHVLGVQQNKIVVRTKRMGGGFGGKETRAMCVALPVAVAARKLKKPIRCMLDRDEDMAITGTRHPFYCTYKVGFMKNGRVTTLKLNIYNNAGNSLDLSCSVLERSVFSADNAYNIPNIDFRGRVCKTNLPSNTAFRGFGGPQGMMFCENVMDTVAHSLQIDPIKVRELNMYKEGDKTHFGQPLEYCTVRRCWDECFKSSVYERKLTEVAAFNKENRFKKRGISLIPTKFGIAFTALFLNQAGALCMVYKDGSVLLSHGGTEMGQGLHTKMIQVASTVLQIPGEKIHIVETSTDKVPNTSPTAASAGADLNGMAVLNACQQIFERLEPYRTKNPKGRWEDWVTAAYFDRVSLSASGYYATPGIGFDFATKSGNPFNYFCFGAACSVVEIDCLSGDHEVKSTDIVMDVGESLNPAIDIGQVEGGFVQGYGLYTLEELRYSPEGFLLTKGPGMYKLPGFGDIPIEFNVALLRGAPNKKAVFSSKAVGEPPLFLAASVFFAIKDAIKAAREENGLPGTFRLDSPATAERIRMGCEDRFTKKVPKLVEGTYKPWSVTA